MAGVESVTHTLALQKPGRAASSMTSSTKPSDKARDLTSLSSTLISRRNGLLPVAPPFIRHPSGRLPLRRPLRGRPLLRAGAGKRANAAFIGGQLAGTSRIDNPAVV